MKFGLKISANLLYLKTLKVKVPADCNKMLQWATALVPSPSIRFLMSSSNDQTTPNPDSAGLYSMHNSDFFKRFIIYSLYNELFLGTE